MSLWLGAVALGLGFAAMCFGVYLSFRILNFPDLTIDGSFALGGATSATLIALGWDAWPSLLPALLLGAAAGATTGLLTTRLRVNGLLASILVMIGLYSVNLRIMGRSNQPLLGVEVITTWPGQLAGEANLGAIGRLGQAGCGRGARPRLRRHRLPDRTAGRQDPEGDGGQGHPDRAAEEGLPGRQHRRRDGAEGQAAGRAAEPGAGEVRQDHPQAM